VSTRIPYVDFLDWDPIRFSFQIGPVDDEGLRAYFQGVEDQLLRDRAEGRRYVLVFDPRHGSPPSIQQRMVQARFIDRMRPVIAEVNIGNVLHTPSPVLRGMLSALFWVASSPSPQVSLGKMPDAVDWAIRQAEAAGLEVPERLREDPEGVLDELYARVDAMEF
jgi:hypothetical protein